MNIKKMLVLSLLLLVIISIIMPVNAKIDTDVDIGSLKTVNDKTKLILSVNSDIGMKAKNYNSASYVSKRKAELNKIQKVVVKVKGHKATTFKKPNKGWKLDKHDYSFFDKSFSVKDKVEKLDNKAYSVKIFDKKNKLIKEKKGKIVSEWVSPKVINNDPQEFFNKLKSKNMKNAYFSFKPFKEIEYYITSSEDMFENILNTSSCAEYFYDRYSEFKKPETIHSTHSSEIKYKTKIMEKTGTYSNGKYRLTIETKKTSNGIFKYLKLVKKVNEKIYNSVENPYFTISYGCNWTNPVIINLAESIKSNVTKNDNKDIYRMELANAVIKYVQGNIKYDYDTYYGRQQNVQTAIATLQRGTGTCMGNTLLAVALLRALGIPTYFEAGWNARGGHVWPVSYVFYENSYQWVPAEPTRDRVEEIPFRRDSGYFVAETIVKHYHYH